MKHPTLTAAASAIGVPVDALRQAKKAGAAGFSINNTVDVEKLTRWLLTKGRDFELVESLESAKARLAGAQADRIKREAQLEAGDMIPQAFARDAMSQALSRMAWLPAKLPDNFSLGAGWRERQSRRTKGAT